jgi:hypothetical protein
MSVERIRALNDRIRAELSSVATSKAQSLMTLPNR